MIRQEGLGTGCASYGKEKTNKKIRSKELTRVI